MPGASSAESRTSFFLPALLLIGLLLALYWQPVTGLVTEWSTNPDASHGVILCVVAGAIAWTRRREWARLDAPGRTEWLAGVGVLGAGLVMYLLGRFAADIFITRVSLVAVVAALVWCASGVRAVRTLAAPLAFLTLAIPLPALIVNAITLPLQLVASRMAEVLLSMASVPVFRDGNVLVLPSAILQVAEACSGLRSVVSLTALAVLLVWATEGRVWRRALILPIAVPVAIALNAVRIAATGLAVERWGSDYASGAWHTFTGWATFVVSVAVLISMQRWLAGLRTGGMNRGVLGAAA